MFNPWLIAAGIFAMIGLLDEANTDKPKPGPAGKAGKEGKAGAAGAAGKEGKTGKEGKAGADALQEPGADG